jgi:hypothetical protein
MNGTETWTLTKVVISRLNSSREDFPEVHKKNQEEKKQKN